LDIGVEKVLPALLKAKPRTILFEAANPRHEHEWAVWKDAKLPDDLVLAPDVIDSTSNFIEHPELVAQRIRHFVDIVGRERVILEVISGRLDAGAFDSPLALALEAKYPQTTTIPAAADCIAHPDIPIPIGVGFSKGDPAFGKFITEVTDGMKASMAKTIEHYSTLEFLADQLGS
jgi:ABC-type amino acid transport substrate-binding protein